MSDGTGLLGLRATDNHRGRLTIDKSLAVTPDEVAKALALIEQAQFWRMPTESSVRGLDGSKWILEGTRNGSYHMVTRWCAGKTPFGIAAFRLISLSGYKLENREIY